jgi:hypothetical protein
MQRAGLFRKMFVLVNLILLNACSTSGSIQITPTQSPARTPTISSTKPASSPIPYSPPEHQIGVRVKDGIGEFFDRATSQKFIPRGMNYVRLGPQTHPSGETVIYHSVFDPDKYEAQRVEAALQRMHEDGYNVVRVFLSQNTIGTAQGGLSEAYMKNVADFLKRAKQNQIYVMFTQDWLPGGKYDAIIQRDCCENFTSMNVHFLSSAGLEANIVFFQDFIQGLFELRAPTDAIFSYELRNELFFDMNLPPLSFTQNTITAANGKTYDMASAQDKERMIEDNLVYWIDAVRAAILERDPSALVSVGFFHPQGPNPARVGDPRLAVTEPAIWRSQADFIDLHAYAGGELSLRQYVENFGLKDMQQKPVIMGEFGGEVSRVVSTDLAAQRFMNWQAESCRYGFDGWLFWTWDTDEQPDFFNALMDDGRIEKALAPFTRPDACSAATTGNTPTNLALNASAVASHARADELPSMLLTARPRRYGTLARMLNNGLRSI